MQLTTKTDEKEIEQAIEDGKKVLYRYHDVWSGNDDGGKVVALFAYIARRAKRKGVWRDHTYR